MRNADLWINISPVRKVPCCCSCHNQNCCETTNGSFVEPSLKSMLELKSGLVRDSVIEILQSEWLNLQTLDFLSTRVVVCVP